MLIGDVDANDLSDQRRQRWVISRPNFTAQFDDLGDLVQVEAGSRKVGLYNCDIIFAGGVQVYPRGIIQHL